MTINTYWFVNIFTVIISVTNAFSKWLKLDLPRFPSPDGKRIETQLLLTNEFQVGWQCHVIKNFYQHGKDTVTANYFLVNYYQQSLAVLMFILITSLWLPQSFSMLIEIVTK